MTTAADIRRWLDAHADTRREVDACRARDNARGELGALLLWRDTHRAADASAIRANTAAIRQARDRLRDAEQRP